jgi:hypothetical protein
METKAAVDEVLKPYIRERSVFIVFRVILTVNRNFFPKQQKLVFLTETHYALCFIGTQFLGAFAKLRETTNNFVMSVCPSAWNNSAPTERIFMKFDIWVFFENLARKFGSY